MTLDFKQSQSTVCPELIDSTSSKTVVYIRQHIVEKTGTDAISGETYTYYEYEEAKLTRAEAEQYTQALALQTIEELKAENQSLTEQVDVLSNCILEMSEILYS